MGAAKSIVSVCSILGTSLEVDCFSKLMPIPQHKKADCHEGDSVPKPLVVRQIARQRRLVVQNPPFRNGTITENRQQ
jgi:hypothetical protein